MNRIPPTENRAAKSTDRDNAASKRKVSAKSIRASRDWRQVREEWENFIDDALCPIHRNPAHIARTRLDHIRTIRIHGRNSRRITQLRAKLSLCTQSRGLVFKNLTQLSLHNIHLHDLGELIALAPSIEILQARKIRCDSNKVMLSMFSGLKRLRVLDLRFKEPCEHMDNAFNMSSRRRIGLPMNLEAIRLSNVYDPEETYFVQPNNNPLRSRWMEDAFVEKYQPFTQLTRLKTLYLGRCNGFTARVWRECIMPCLKNLTHVTLAGWLDKANNDLDVALRETIGHMQTIEQLDFVDFVCGDGIIQGIHDIHHRTPILVKAKFANPNLPKPITIADLLNQHVMFCRLKFANKA
ncbi:hypothetical protein BJV82DRAFT_582487 [Fennellomyces sp. T-0311]|nr:hypothetical protein BJV82DRAFT_582487 [Fennellomyces sp. T-0311]